MKRLSYSMIAAAILSGPAAAQTEAPRSVAPETMRRWAPALAEYTDQVLFGDVWRRDALSPRDRSLVTISALIATGKTAQLEGHLGRALDNGVRPSEIGGIVTHLAFYSGWPNAVSALAVVDAVMASRGIKPVPADAAANAPALRKPAGDTGQAPPPAQESGEIASTFTRLSKDVVSDDLWRRRDLSLRDRSLVTIVAIMASADTAQLGEPIRRGMANGLTRDQIAEALTHLAFYVGWPKATAAIAMLGSVAPGVAASEPLAVVSPGQRPQRAPADHFSGAAIVSSAFGGGNAPGFGGATVSFRPGARTNWHTHANGQLLVIVSGEGRVQEKGGAVRTIRAGDVVWTPPGVAHWHGAAPDAPMIHVALSEAGGGGVSWGEPVSDDVYRASR